MKTIYKYSIDIADEINIVMPEGARILSVQVQHGFPYMWVLVDTNAARITRRFRIVGTGHPADDVSEYRFIETFQTAHGNLVFHIFEVV